MINLNLFSQQAKTMIPAHDSPLAALAFSPNGTKVATASEKGTVIRVFNVRFVNKISKKKFYINKFFFRLMMAQNFLNFAEG